MTNWKFKPPAYPRELTPAWWQTNKGAIAKIATRNDGTGIGKSLTALEAAFKKIDWDPVDFFEQAPGHAGSRTPDLIKQGIANAKQAAANIQPVYKMAVQLERDAATLAADWAKSKVIPKSSTAAAKKVSEKARELSFQLSTGTIAGWVERGVKEEAAVAEHSRAEVRRLLGDLPNKLDQLIKDANAGMPVEEWQNWWGPHLRHVGTLLGAVLKANPNAAPEVRALRVHANTLKLPRDQQQLNTWLREIATAAAALKQKLP
jgi:hypothetical protein